MLPSNITGARETASSLSTTAGNAAAGAASIGDILKQKVLDAYGNNQDLVKPLDTATMNYVGSPTTARDQFSGIFNPSQREALISQYTGNQAIPMLSLASVLGQRFGRVEDTIGAGTRAYSADVAAKQAAADNAWKTYQALLGEYQMANPAKNYQIGSVGKTGYVFDPSTGEIKQTFIGADSGSGGTDISSLLSLLFPNGINGGQTINQPTEPKPNLNMNNFPQGGKYRSPGGQWAYDWQSRDWVPIID